MRKALAFLIACGLVVGLASVLVPTGLAARGTSGPVIVHLSGPATPDQIAALASVDVAKTMSPVFIDRKKTSATGAGAYVAVLDGGLVPSWREVLDESRVRGDLGRGFNGANGRP